MITGTPLHPRLYPHLKWDCTTRRILTQLFYKIQNQLVAIPFPPIVSPATYYGRYDHNLKYVVPAGTIDVYKFSFFPGAIRIWNHLPAQAVNTKGLSTSKRLPYQFSGWCSLLWVPAWHKEAVFDSHQAPSKFSTDDIALMWLVHQTMFTIDMHTILKKVAFLSDLKTCQEDLSDIATTNVCKWITSIEIPLLGTG